MATSAGLFVIDALTVRLTDVVAVSGLNGRWKSVRNFVFWAQSKE